MFVILKQSIDTIKVETDVSIHNEEDVIGKETDELCVPQECEREVSHILSWFFCGGVCWCIFLCVVLHTCNYWDWLICSPVVCWKLCICYDVKGWDSVLVLQCFMLQQSNRMQLCAVNFISLQRYSMFYGITNRCHNVQWSFLCTLWHLLVIP